MTAQYPFTYVQLKSRVISKQIPLSLRGVVQFMDEVDFESEKKKKKWGILLSTTVYL